MLDSIDQTPINEIPCGKITLNNQTYNLIIVDRKPCIDVNGKRYHNHDDLFKANTSLQKVPNDPQDLEKLARLVMFARFGEKFKVGNVEEFKELFRKKMHEAALDFGKGAPGYEDLENRQFETMCAPRVERNSFVFFCIDDYRELPYKVTLPFPVKQGYQPQFELLPVAGE